MTRLLDGRREAALLAELRSRAAAVFGPNADAIKPGEVLDAILSVSARLGEEVAKRLDRVPDKQAGNFYSAMGLGRAPPSPARVPVAFGLAETAADRLLAPAGTRLAATIAGKPVAFETHEAISLARGKLVSLAAADLVEDRIVFSPPGPLAAALPHKLPVRRELLSDAGAGTFELQIEPSDGLAKGMSLRIGEPAVESDVTVTKVEGNVVTVDPPLTATHGRLTVVEEVTRFAPFAPGARDRQGHFLYLGHASLLDIPSETSIVVSGIESGDYQIEWAWFGKANEAADKPDWQPIVQAALDARGDWVLTKPVGKPEKTSIGGHNNLWLRARLNDPSTRPERARSIRLMIGGTGDCALGKPLECSTNELGIAYEAIAVAAPAVTSKPFHPFGTEPRQFDSFYVGCDEAFGKPGAKVRLCFKMGGAALGPLACVSDPQTKQVFAVGTDGQLYRATLGSNPLFAMVPPPAELAATGFPQQAAIDARIDGGLIRVAVAGVNAVHTTTLNAGLPANAGQVVWQSLNGDDDSKDVVPSAVFVTTEVGGSCRHGSA